MDVLLWLQDAQEHMDSQLDWFSTRDLELNNPAPPYVFDSKQKVTKTLESIYDDA